jgi:hypothetical protein
VCASGNGCTWEWYVVAWAGGIHAERLHTVEQRHQRIGDGGLTCGARLQRRWGGACQQVGWADAWNARQWCSSTGWWAQDDEK